MTIETFAKDNGLSLSTAYRRLRARGVYPLDLITLPLETLQRLYCDEGKSLREIASILKCDRDTVGRNLKASGIMARTHQDAMRLVGDQKKTARFLHRHSNWRGGRNSLPKPEGYYKAHRWIKYHYGKTDRCDLNLDHDSTVYDWANISGEYRQERSDWIRLCHSCHYWFDHPEIPKAQIEELTQDAKHAYLEGRRRRNGACSTM